MAKTFKDDQQRYHRVRQARINKEAIVNLYFDTVSITYPPHQIFLRNSLKEIQMEKLVLLLISVIYILKNFNNLITWKFWTISNH